MKIGVFVNRTILRSWSNPSDKMSLWSRPYRVLILITRWAFSKERKVAPKRAQIRPDLHHPHGYLPRASKRHTARSWGHTRELADILSVSYVGESVPGKYSLTIRRKNDRFGEVFPQKLIIYLRILDILSLNSHRKSKSTPPLKANLQFVYRNQWSLI